MAGLTDLEIALITQRDITAGGGVAEHDYDCAHDRHVLLEEVARLRAILGRVRSGRPISDIGA